MWGRAGGVKDQRGIRPNQQCDSAAPSWRGEGGEGSVWVGSGPPERVDDMWGIWMC